MLPPVLVSCRSTAAMADRSVAGSQVLVQQGSAWPRACEEGGTRPFGFGMDQAVARERRDTGPSPNTSRAQTFHVKRCRLEPRGRRVLAPGRLPHAAREALVAFAWMFHVKRLLHFTCCSTGGRDARVPEARPPQNVSRETSTNHSRFPALACSARLSASLGTNGHSSRDSR